MHTASVHYFVVVLRRLITQKTLYHHQIKYQQDTFAVCKMQMRIAHNWIENRKQKNKTKTPKKKIINNQNVSLSNDDTLVDSRQRLHFSHKKESVKLFQSNCISFFIIPDQKNIGTLLLLELKFSGFFSFWARRADEWAS